MVGFFIKDACTESNKKISEYLERYSPQYSSVTECINEKCIMLSPEVEEERYRIYHEMIEKKVILSEQISISDAKSEYIIRQLFRAYYSHPKQLPDYVLQKYCDRCGILFDRAELDDRAFQKDSRFVRTICDHISGMTDQFAAREYLHLYMPEYK